MSYTDHIFNDYGSVSKRLRKMTIHFLRASPTLLAQLRLKSPLGQQEIRCRLVGMTAKSGIRDACVMMIVRRPGAAPLLPVRSVVAAGRDRTHVKEPSVGRFNARPAGSARPRR